MLDFSTYFDPTIDTRNRYLLLQAVQSAILSIVAVPEESSCSKNIQSIIISESGLSISNESLFILKNSSSRYVIFYVIEPGHAMISVFDRQNSTFILFDPSEENNISYSQTAEVISKITGFKHQVIPCSVKIQTITNDFNCAMWSALVILNICKDGLSMEEIVRHYNSYTKEEKEQQLSIDRDRMYTERMRRTIEGFINYCYNILVSDDILYDTAKEISDIIRIIEINVDFFKSNPEEGKIIINRIHRLRFDNDPVTGLMIEKEGKFGELFHKLKDRAKEYGTECSSEQMNEILNRFLRNAPRSNFYALRDTLCSLKEVSSIGPNIVQILSLLNKPYQLPLIIFKSIKELSKIRSPGFLDELLKQSKLYGTVPYNKMVMPLIPYISGLNAVKGEKALIAKSILFPLLWFAHHFPYEITSFDDIMENMCDKFEVPKSPFGDIIRTCLVIPPYDLFDRHYFLRQNLSSKELIVKAIIRAGNIYSKYQPVLSEEFVTSYVNIL